MATAHRNVSFAAADSFEEVLRDGQVISVRGNQSREIRNKLTVIARPFERCLFLPGRGNCVFGQIAETLWVLDGRDDVAWVSRHVPRIAEFSDNGITLHAAYGPRLRKWASSIDQVDEWRKLLIRDGDTRRAVGVLFDPSRDFTDGKDVPCNNWLSWIIRDGKLHLNVALRSNDAMWGFSGINAFEWSILLEMLAFWVGVGIGDMTLFATSFHLYEHHYERARNVVRQFSGITPYSYGIESPRFRTPWDSFEQVARDWFLAEQDVSIDSDRQIGDRPAMRDPLLASMLRLMRLKHGKATWSEDRLRSELAALPEDDFAAAAYEHCGRKLPALLKNISQPGISRFFVDYRNGKSEDLSRIRQAIKNLHTRKNRSYASAWKRRGERVSVLPNIARKVDRLQAFSDNGTILKGETLVDTAIDLYVYATKYCLLLSEQPGADRSFLPDDAPSPASDHDENFDRLIEVAEFNWSTGDLGPQILKIMAAFESAWTAADSGAHLKQRQTNALELRVETEHLVGILIQSDLRTVSAFIATEDP